MLRITGIWSSALAAALSFFALSARAQTYTAIDLGTLRAGSARVHGVNELGQAVGGSGHPHGAETHAFFWDKKGGMRDLGTLPGGDYSAAFDINNSGVVVGVSNTATNLRAFSWNMTQGLHDLGMLPGSDSSSAFSINNQGQIAGMSGSHAVLWTSGAIQDLGTLGGATSEAHAVNNLGAGMTQGWLWERQRGAAESGHSSGPVQPACSRWPMVLAAFIVRLLPSTILARWWEC